MFYFISNEYDIILLVTWHKVDELGHYGIPNSALCNSSENDWKSFKTWQKIIKCNLLLYQIELAAITMLTWWQLLRKPAI